MILKNYLDVIGNAKTWNILRLYYETSGQYSGSDVARLLKANKNNILTNYTASYEASKIYKSLGFKGSFGAIKLPVKSSTCHE